MMTEKQWMANKQEWLSTLLTNAWIKIDTGNRMISPRLPKTCDLVGGKKTLHTFSEDKVEMISCWHLSTLMRPSFSFLTEQM
jgi:hypothetical protein